MDSPISSWRPTAALLDWAFAHGASLTPIGELVEPGAPTKSEPTVAPGRPQSRPTGPRHASAQAAPRLSAVPPWFGVAGLFSALALVVTWRRRNISRRRR